jgi:hypothetical protein
MRLVRRRLTIRSSRPRIVASATCLRYASTRPPPRCGGGLTQALGGQKHSVVVLLAAAVVSLRSAWLFGHVLGASLLRSRSSGALKRHKRCARRLRNHRSTYGRHVRPRCGHFGDDRRTVRLARSGIRASVFVLFVMASLSPASFAPNQSFKPTPSLGFVETCRSASNTGSHLPRSARLNSGVSRQSRGKHDRSYHGSCCFGLDCTTRSSAHSYYRKQVFSDGRLG